MKNCTHVRQHSQNEMIEVIGKKIIQKDIIDEMISSGMHSILCDEVSSSNDGITGEALYVAISNFYQTHSFNLQELCGQCYDGASNI